MSIRGLGSQLAILAWLLLGGSPAPASARGGAVDADCDDADSDDGNACTTNTCVSTTCVDTWTDVCCSEVVAAESNNTLYSPALRAACAEPGAYNHSVHVYDLNKCNGQKALCDADWQCADGQPGTRDVCLNGVCKNFNCASFGCQVCCTQDSECQDSNPDTIDRCIDGACANTPHGTPCAVDSDCADGHSCTVDRCINGLCDGMLISSVPSAAGACAGPGPNCCSYGATP